jgi:signal transduction histidine kinase
VTALIAQSKLTISQKGLVLISVPLIFELIFVIALAVLLQKADYEAWREAHARVLVTESGTLMVLVNGAVQQLLSYGVFRSSTFREKYEQSIEEIKEQGQLLKRLAAEDPNSKESVPQVEKMLNRALEGLGSASDTINLSSRPQGLTYGQGLELQVASNQVLQEIRNFLEIERGVENLDPKAEERARALVIACLGIGVLFNIALAIALAVFFGQQISNRLGVLVDNTKKLAEEKPLNPLLDGSDEIAQLDQVFHKMADALVEAAARRKEVMQMVSHDLRSPLSSTQASLSFVLMTVKGKLDEAVDEEIASAKRNTSRLIKLINDFLDYEKMAAGKLVLTNETAALSEIFERSVEAVHGLLEQKELTVEISAENTKVCADPERLVQVVVNLLSNAIKFSPQRETIRLSAMEQGEFVEVRVSDRGLGVPPEFKDKIFESFEQIEDSSGAMKGSTGLGLSICKSIIVQHGGTIGVDRNVEAGSTFWFRLPVERA